MASAILTEYEILQLLKLRAARISQMPSPPVPVTTARRLADLQLVTLPADPRSHYLAGSVEITDRGLSELERHFQCRSSRETSACCTTELTNPGSNRNADLAMSAAVGAL